MRVTQVSSSEGFRSAAGERLAFADILRGLASVIVVLGHFTYLYLHSPSMVASLIYSEPAAVVNLPGAVLSVYDFFNAASVGVAVFFLISGFVIPLSIENADVRGYFIKRLLRIYPTFWVALALSIVALVISSTYWAKPLPLTWRDYLANSALVTEWSGRFDILSVAWTLQIELKFYLIAPLIAWAIARNRTPLILLWAFGVAGLYWLATAGCDADLLTCWGRRAPWVYVAWEGLYITFMLIGSVFYAHYRRRVSTLTATLLIAVLFASFTVSYFLSHLSAMGPARNTILPYAEALVIFTVFYFNRNRLRLVQPLKFFADVSYPLYVVHPLVGYTIMRILTAQGVPYVLALALALIIVFSLATLMHRYVEKPSIALGKRLAKRAARRRAPPDKSPPLEAATTSGSAPG